MRQRSTKPAIVGILFAVFLIPSGSLVAQQARRAEPWESDPAVLRVRTLETRVADFERAPARAEVSLELFDGASIVARLGRFDHTASGGITWYGALDGQGSRIATGDEDYLAFAVRQGAFVGVIRRAGKLYRLRDSRAGELVLYETDPSVTWECGNDERSLPSVGQDPGPASPGGETPTQALRRGKLSQSPGGPPPLVEYVPHIRVPTQVDVLVAWTQEAENAVGSAAAMQAMIDLAILETNVAFANSEVDMTLYLAMSSRIDYVESGNMATDLTRLRIQDDGFMDDIHAWRDTSGADIVSLFLADSSKCGRSYNMGAPASASFASSAFNLVSTSCATGYYAFAHEVGHNAGLDHDRVNTQNTPSHPYAYGYWLDSTYRTIMGLQVGENSGTRIQYFSNPDLTYQGLPLGVEDPSPTSADCARALNENRAIIADWRTAPIPARTAPAVSAGRMRVESHAEGVSLEIDDPRGTIPEGSVPFLLVTRRPIPTLDGRPFLRDLSQSLLSWQRLPPWHPDRAVLRELSTSPGTRFAQLVVFDPSTREFQLGPARRIGA